MYEPNQTPDDRFSHLFGSTPKDVESGYDELRRKLVRFFQSKRVSDPDLLADETIARAVKRVMSGAEVNPNIGAFCHGIAKFVLLEESKKRPSLSIEDTGEPSPAPRPGLNNLESAEFLRDVLGSVPEEDAAVFVEYHQGDRRSLCDRLRTTENALRIRIARIKSKLNEAISPKTRKKN